MNGPAVPVCDRFPRREVAAIALANPDEEALAQGDSHADSSSRNCRLHTLASSWDLQLVTEVGRGIRGRDDGCGRVEGAHDIDEIDVDREGTEKRSSGLPPQPDRIGDADAPRKCDGPGGAFVTRYAATTHWTNPPEGHRGDK